MTWGSMITDVMTSSVDAAQGRQILDRGIERKIMMNIFVSADNLTHQLTAWCDDQRTARHGTARELISLYYSYSTASSAALIPRKYFLPQ